MRFALLFASKLPPDMQTARPFIENLLAKGKLEAAIEGSLILCRHYGDQERNGIAAQHSARYHALMNDYHAGTLNDDDYRPERARINRAMLDFAQEIPGDWTESPLMQAGFSASAFDQAAMPGQKSFFEKWGLVIGLVASLLIILGITLKGVIFPEKEKVATEQPVEMKPDIPEPSTKREPDIKENPDPTAANKTVKPKPEIKPSTKVSAPAQQPSNTRPSTLATPDERFRSFGKSIIADGMERGRVGNKQAFRNIQTNEILCCYQDAEDFSGGKAYVSKDGVTYYYMDKKGNKVQ